MSLSAIKGMAPIISWIVDLGIVWFLVYRALVIIRGTRAMPMMVGLLAIATVYFVAQPLGLVTLGWLIDNFLSSIILVIVVIFQDEIRRTLTKVGAHPLLFSGGRMEQVSHFDEIGVAVGKLSRARVGALIVLERDVGLDELIEDSVELDARLSRKLLFSIFVKESALHDGAVIIDGGVIRAAGVVLPLSSNPDIDPSFGTRHRAALGISERSDAVVIVVSEESGSVTLLADGAIFRNVETSKVAGMLEQFARGETTEQSRKGKGKA
jgi:diadenylate cyclase